MCLIMPREGVRAGQDPVPGSGLRRCDPPRSCHAAASRGAGDAERRRAHHLEETRPGAKTAWQDRLRAQIVLAAARGHPNAWIAAGLGVSLDTVRKWRGRFAARGLDGLQKLSRPGRPRRISAADRAAVVALACQLPAATGVPLGWRPERWPAPCRRHRSCGSWLSTRSSRGSTSQPNEASLCTPVPGQLKTITLTLVGARRPTISQEEVTVKGRSYRSYRHDSRPPLACRTATARAKRT